VTEKYAKDGDELLKGFKSALGKAVNRAGKEHAKLKGKDPEFDSEEMIEGTGGFLEPGDDGVK